MAAETKPLVVGAPNTFDHKVYLSDAKSGQVLSFFHDLPLYAVHSPGV